MHFCFSRRIRCIALIAALLIAGCANTTPNQEREPPADGEGSPGSSAPSLPTDSSVTYTALLTPQLDSDVPPEELLDPALATQEPSWRRISEWQHLIFYIGASDSGICILIESTDGGIQTCGNEWGAPLYFRYQEEGVDLSAIVLADGFREASFGDTTCSVRGNIAATARLPLENFQVTAVDETGNEIVIVSDEAPSINVSATAAGCI